jgi:hypothetical protein
MNKNIVSGQDSLTLIYQGGKKPVNVDNYYL